MNYNEIRELVDYSLSEFNLKIPVQIEFSNRMTRAIGRATYFRGKGYIKLSSKLWERADRIEHENTVIHEAAHIIQFIQFPGQGGKDGHGKVWHSIHNKIGGIPSKYTCVSAAGLRKPIRILEFSCNCPGKLFRLKQTFCSRRYNRDGSVGRCPACKTRLKPLGDAQLYLEQAHTQFAARNRYK